MAGQRDQRREPGTTIGNIYQPRPRGKRKSKHAL